MPRLGAGLPKILIFSADADYFAAYIDDELVGCAAIKGSGATVNFKAEYVRPEFRGKGAWRALFDRRREESIRRGHRTIRAHCTPMSLPAYLNRGAVPGRTYKNGLVEVTLPL